MKRTEIIKEILNISPKRKDINYYNYLVSLTDSELTKELKKLSI